MAWFVPRGDLTDWISMSTVEIFGISLFWQDQERAAKFCDSGIYTVIVLASSRSARVWTWKRFLFFSFSTRICAPGCSISCVWQERQMGYCFHPGTFQRCLLFLARNSLENMSYEAAFRNNKMLKEPFLYDWNKSSRTSEFFSLTELRKIQSRENAINNDIPYAKAIFCVKQRVKYENA